MAGMPAGPGAQRDASVLGGGAWTGDGHSRFRADAPRPVRGKRKAPDLRIGAGGGMNRHPRPPDPAVEPGRGQVREARGAG